MLITVTVIGTKSFAANEKEDKKHNLKIVYYDEYVLDENFKDDSHITIQAGDKELKTFNISEDERIEIDKIDVPDDKIISYWEVEEKENEYIISPVTIDKKDVHLNFTTTNGGVLKENDSQLPSITKSVEKGTKLKDITPGIENEEDYYFAGWYTLENTPDQQEVEDLKVHLETREKKLSEENDKSKDEKDKDTIKDLEKEIDDLEEEISDKQDGIEVSKEYKEVENIDNVEADESKDYVGILYPDFNENKKDDRKEKIDLSVDFGLDTDKHKEEIHIGQPVSLAEPYDKDNIFIDWYKDSEFNEKFENGETLTKDTSIHGKWETPEEIISKGGEELIYKERVSNRMESYLDNKNKDIKEEKKKISKEKEKELKKKESEGNGQQTEAQYTLKHFNQEQEYLIKFYDDEDFLFSLPLPYGRTLELVDNNDNKIKEYGVRNKSTIDISNIIPEEIEGKDFDVKTVERNNATITQLITKQEKENE